MIKKRIVLILLAMVMLVTAVPLVSSAESVFGNFGNNLSYSVEDRTLIISSTGGDYIPEKDLPWFAGNWKYKIEVVVIKEGITSIGPNAFSYLLDLKRVVLPSTLTKLDNWVFNGCSALEEVRFDNGFSLSTIGNGVFAATSPNGIRFYAPTGDNVAILKALFETETSKHTFHLSQAKFTGYYASIGSSLRMNFLVQMQNEKTPADLGLKAEFYRNNKIAQGDTFVINPTLEQTITADGFIQDQTKTDTWVVTCDHYPPQYMGTDLIVKILDEDGNILCTGSCSFLRYCNTVYEVNDMAYTESTDTKGIALKSLLSATLNFGEIARQNTDVVWAESLPSWVEQQDGVLSSEIIENIANKKASSKTDANSGGFQCVELLVDADSYLEFTLNYESIGEITDIKVYRLPKNSEINKDVLLNNKYDQYLCDFYNSFDDNVITLLTKPVSPVDFDTMFYVEIIGINANVPQLKDWATYSINSFIKIKLEDSYLTESDKILFSAYYLYGQAAYAYANPTTETTEAEQ